MKTVLMVAEKPSLAQSLAQILSNGQMKSRKGANGACQVHEFIGNFRSSEKVKFKMTSVCGHVMSTDFLGKYNNWDRVDPADLFQAPIEKKEANEKLKMPWFLSTEAKGCDYLVLWLDCDKEGENICFEVINAVKSSMIPSNNPREQIIFRAKFSAITDKDIKAAMNKLGEPNENESKSVDARQELDLRIGCAFTRFQTKFFQGKYGNLDSNLISFGPCQTPTLGFCVDRHDAIQSFKPEPYWVLQPEVEYAGKTFHLEWARGRLFDKDVAQMFLNTIKTYSNAEVLNIARKEKVKQRPQALNTVELMRVASSGLNIGPSQAMQIAERLYIQGYISYPRTETTHYSDNFDLMGTLHQQKSNSEWGQHVSDLLREGIIKPRKGTDAGDHPPITPTKPASRQQLDGDSWRLYDFITRHFIASLSKDCKYESTTINFLLGDEKFSCSGNVEIDPGFTNVIKWQSLGVDQTLPNIPKGTKLTVSNVKLKECLTSPPCYLTEAELITLMEKHGIGTDASIPVHINNICQRNYVNVTSGRRLVPTSLGIVLVHGYQKIDVDLVLPTMRSAVEEQLNLIAVGKADFRSVLQHTLKIFTLKFHYFVQNVLGMDELFEVSFSPLSDTGKPMCRCGKCHRFLKYIAAKPSRLHCSHCDETYSLPQNGIIKLYKELKCPLDDFELLSWSGGSIGKSYPFCPYCFNNPPFGDMRKLSGCNNCSHPTCQHSVANTGICACDKCSENTDLKNGELIQPGILVLDPSSGPKWKLTCNKCDVIVKLFKDASKLSIDSNNSCERCNSLLMSIEYKAEKTKLANGALTASGCIFCDPDLNKFVARKIAVRQIPGRNFKGGRGRKRGGRGGRGRNRGR